MLVEDETEACFSVPTVSKPALCDSHSHRRNQGLLSPRTHSLYRSPAWPAPLDPRLLLSSVMLPTPTLKQRFWEVEPHLAQGQLPAFPEVRASGTLGLLMASGKSTQWKLASAWQGLRSCEVQTGTPVASAATFASAKRTAVNRLVWSRL